MQLFHLAFQFITNPINLTLDSLLIMSGLFSIDLALLQDELIECQAEYYELLNDNFIFWRSIHKQTIILLVIRILSLVLSTYICEASFFALNDIQSKRRSKLTYEHLQSAFICADSNLMFNYEFPSTDQQCQLSH